MLIRTGQLKKFFDATSPLMVRFSSVVSITPFDQLQNNVHQCTQSLDYTYAHNLTTLVNVLQWIASQSNSTYILHFRSVGWLVSTLMPMPHTMGRR